MYWVPAVDRASVGPLKVKPTGVLSTRSVSLGDDTLAGLAASAADSVSDSGPSGYCVVSTVRPIVSGLGHCVQL
jgi:hypothetical protein